MMLLPAVTFIAATLSCRDASLMRQSARYAAVAMPCAQFFFFFFFFSMAMAAAITLALIAPLRYHARAP